MRKKAFSFFLLLLILFTCPTTAFSTKKEKHKLNPLVPENLNNLQTTIDNGQVLPDESGQIMVLMYHGLDKYKQSAPYMRTIKGFKEDLNALYDNGFRPITVEDYVNNNITVKEGFTPVLLTFDDGLNTAFSFVKENGELVPRKDCAVDIMNKFALEHPDFGKAGVFFINGDAPTAFVGEATLRERFMYLLENGYEIGNHTFTHPFLGKINTQKIKEEIATLDKLVYENTDGYKIRCLAYPYGNLPSKSNLKYALEGEYNGHKYKYDVAFRATPSASFSNPILKGFDNLNAPRIRGTDCSSMDLGWQLKKYKEDVTLRYISDGNHDIITIPASKASKIDYDAIKEKTLNVYTTESKS